MIYRLRIFHESWGGIRYMGTFNDPNQMAFFLFMMLLLIWMYRCRFGDRTFLILLLLSLPVMAASKSVGIWLGLAVWTAVSLPMRFTCRIRGGKVSDRMIRIFGAVIIFGVIIALYFLWPPVDFNVRAVDYTLLNRIREKIWRITNGGLYDLLAERGFGRISRHPQYLLFGAGEGGFERFADAGPINELHSTPLSILFCYGLIPTVLLVLWLRKVLKANTPWMWCGILALLAESLVLINYRQPMFWMILLYGDVTRKAEDGHLTTFGKIPPCLSLPQRRNRHNKHPVRSAVGGVGHAT